jgi:hypothetical protein
VKKRKRIFHANENAEKEILFHPFDYPNFSYAKENILRILILIWKIKRCSWSKWATLVFLGYLWILSVNLLRWI